jgi:protein-disulfide isomerase
MPDPLFHHKLAMPVSARDHSRGPDAAPVVFVVYGDYQCPFTAQLHLTISKIEGKFPDSIRHIFRHFPLFNRHPHAQLCAESVEAAAAQNKFWDMHAWLFQRQYDFNREALSAACKLLSLDFDRLDREITEHTHLPRIHEDVAAAKHSGVAGTPALFINNQLYEADDDFDTLSRHIEPLLPPEPQPKTVIPWAKIFGPH